MVPFLDLQAQTISIRPKLNAAIAEVLDGGSFILGPAVKRFEGRFAEFCGVRHAIAVNSGTSALHLAQLAAGVNAGDEVITTPSTFVATVASILYIGARPILVDIDQETGNIDPNRVEDAITERTKAIIPVHLHGLPANMTDLATISEKNGIPIIEDAAQAHGAEINGKRVGSMGNVGCFSFYPGKNLGACGEGGMVVTNDDKLAKRVSQLRDWGQEKKHFCHTLGFNYRMDGFQGAVLNVKLDHLEDWTEKRRSNASYYREKLRHFGWRLPSEPKGFKHVYHVFAPDTNNRDVLIERLKARGIGYNIHYPIPVHLQEGYSQLGYRAGDFPHSEFKASATLSLPMYPELTNEQIDQVVAALE
ncbi:MAG: DegT/DnrJ/EryC1/StrS family aminotransferase [Magnetococcales bacterium]|nr:DegT/DnrJ/EryC1/StrS family aminotransferase [Magnetococcales bacterium]